MSVSKTPKSLRSSLRMSAAPSAAVLGLSAAMLMPLAAEAQEAEQLETVKVQDTAIDPNPNAQVGVPYKARTSGDERRTRPLAETPQTIQVITAAQIEDSGYTDLAQILDAQPGITIGTGENGNAFGDRYIIRGQEARSDVFVDGLRDPGMTIRESFAVDQVEITKGPSSSFAGRGSAGGAINSITKQANTNLNFGSINVGVGTDQYVRTTLDVNRTFGDSFAVRANALYGYMEVPERGPADRERKGFAISGIYTPTDDFSLTLDYYGLRAKDAPDLGNYLLNRKPANYVPSYVQAEDFLESDVDTFTARLKYQFSPNFRVTNLTRYGQSDNAYVATGARGVTTASTNAAGVYPTATLSTHQSWQEVEYLANQTNFFLDAELFGREHDFIFGAEYTDHQVLNGVFRTTNRNAPNCTTPTNNNPAPATPNAYCLFGPNGALANRHNLLNRQITRGPWDIDWQVKTISAYVMDTVDLTDRLTVFGGVRLDDFDFDIATQNTTTLARTPYAYSDTLWSGHFGVTYKLGGGGMVYASWSSSADINGGESDVGLNSGYGGIIVVSGRVAATPERSHNIEIGTKWNVRDERLLLTAALFQTTKSDVMESEADYSTTGSFNTGKNRVQGVEIGMTGALTDKLSIDAGLTAMESEVLSSFAPARVGKRLSNFANVSATAQLRYQATEKFYFGGTVRYESKRFAGQPDAAAAFANGDYSMPIPEYVVANLFASYRITPDLEARLNINNVTDEDYYVAAYRSGAFLYKGDGRNARLTLTYDF